MDKSLITALRRVGHVGLMLPRPYKQVLPEGESIVVDTADLEKPEWREILPFLSVTAPEAEEAKKPKKDEKPKAEPAE